MHVVHTNTYTHKTLTHKCTHTHAVSKEIVISERKKWPQRKKQKKKKAPKVMHPKLLQCIHKLEMRAEEKIRALIGSL